MLGLKRFSPPSDEGGGFCEAKDGGREGVKPQENSAFSLPQSRCARQLPRQREPNDTPTFAKEPILSSPFKEWKIAFSKRGRRLSAYAQSKQALLICFCDIKF